MNHLHQVALGHLAAIDFLTVEAWTLGGLIRYHVLVAMDLSTRRVEIAGISTAPDGAWMSQMARILSDPFKPNGVLREETLLIHDRDPLFTREFGAVGVQPSLTSTRSSSGL